MSFLTDLRPFLVRTWSLGSRVCLLGVLVCGCLEDLSALSNGAPRLALSSAGNSHVSATAGSSSGGSAGDASSSGNASASNAGDDGGGAGKPDVDQAGAAGESAGNTCAFYLDDDRDGYGDPSRSSSKCSPPAGFVTDDTDCNDANPAIHPGAGEVCDTADNDCDSKTNDICPVGCAALVGPASHIYMACSLTKNITWSTAEGGCETQGMKLARVDDAAENEFVNTIQRALASNPKFMWIGGTDLPFPGTWRFADGTTFWQNASNTNGLYTNWRPGEPTEGKEHCLGMWIDDATWNDFDCVAATSPGYVCELY